MAEGPIDLIRLEGEGNSLILRMARVFIERDLGEERAADRNRSS